MTGNKEALPVSAILTFLWVIFLILFNFAVTNTAAPYIIGSLGGSNTMSSYPISLFGIGNAMTIPLALALRGCVRHRTLMIVGMTAFFLSSFFAGISTTFVQLLICRLCQGLATGPLFVSVTRMFVYYGTEEQGHRFIAYILIVFIVSSTLGAVWGGFLAYVANWRWIFYIDAFLLAITTLTIAKVLKNFPIELEEHSFDFVGYLSYALTLLCIGVYFTTGQELDWYTNPYLATALGLGIFSGIFFALWSKYQKHPILEVKHFKELDFVFALFLLIFLFSSYFGMILLLSLWLKFDVKYSVAWVNIVLGVMALSSFVIMIAIVNTKHDRRLRTLLVAIALITFSTFYMTIFNTHVDLFRVTLSRVLAGIGYALFLPPVFSLCIKNFEGNDRLMAITYFQLSRTLSSGLGAAIWTTVWQRRSVFYHSRLGGQINSFSKITRDFFDRAKNFNLSKNQGLLELNDFLNRRSSSLALNDTCYLIGWILVGIFIISFLMLLKRWKQKRLGTRPYYIAKKEEAQK